jgi:hypothetical protein
MTVVPLVHPGQRCGLCLHFTADPENVAPSGWGLCMAQPDGEPLRLPVPQHAGSHCRIWRERRTDP